MTLAEVDTDAATEILYVSGANPSSPLAAQAVIAAQLAAHPDLAYFTAAMADAYGTQLGDPTSAVAHLHRCHDWAVAAVGTGGTA